MDSIRELEIAFAKGIGKDPAIIRNYARRLMDAGLLPKGAHGRQGQKAHKPTSEDAAILLIAYMLGSEPAQAARLVEEAKNAKVSFAGDIASMSLLSGAMTSASEPRPDVAEQMRAYDIRLVSYTAALLTNRRNSRPATSNAELLSLGSKTDGAERLILFHWRDDTDPNKAHGVGFGIGLSEMALPAAPLQSHDCRYIFGDVLQYLAKEMGPLSEAEQKAEDERIAEIVRALSAASAAPAEPEATA